MRKRCGGGKKWIESEEENEHTHTHGMREGKRLRKAKDGYFVCFFLSHFMPFAQIVKKFHRE